jgi:hypothetical protein
MVPTRAKAANEAMAASFAERLMIEPPDVNRAWAL